MIFGSDPKIFGEAVANFLTSRHPMKTAANVAAETGCSVHQIEKWLERASAPSGVALMRLIWAYGPEFLAAMSPRAPGWLNESVRSQRQARLEEDIAAKQRELESLLAAR